MYPPPSPRQYAGEVPMRRSSTEQSGRGVTESAATSSHVSYAPVPANSSAGHPSDRKSRKRLPIWEPEVRLVENSIKPQLSMNQNLEKDYLSGEPESRKRSHISTTKPPRIEKQLNVNLLYVHVFDKIRNKKILLANKKSSTVGQLQEQLGLITKSKKRILAGSSGELVFPDQELGMHSDTKGRCEFIIEKPILVQLKFEGNVDEISFPSGTTVGDILSTYENRIKKPLRLRDKTELFYGREIRLSEARDRYQRDESLIYWIEEDPWGIGLGSELEFPRIATK